MSLTLNRRTLALLLILALLALLLLGVATFHALHPTLIGHVHAVADSTPDIIVHNH